MNWRQQEIKRLEDSIQRYKEWIPEREEFTKSLREWLKGDIKRLEDYKRQEAEYQQAVLNGEICV